MTIPNLNIFSKRFNQDNNPSITSLTENLNNEDQGEEVSEKEILLKTIKKQVKQLMEEFVNRKYVHEYSSNVISFCASVEACLLLGLKRRALGLFKESSSLALLEKIAKQNAVAKSICTLMSLERIQYHDSLSDTSHHSSNTNSSISSRSDYSNSSTFGHSWSASSFLGLNSNKLFSSNNQSSDNEFVNLHFRNLIKHYWIRLALTEKVLDKIIDYLVKNSARFYNSGSIIGDPCYGYILVSLMSGPCSLEYSRLRNPEIISDDPDAGELIQRQKIQNQSGSTGIEAGKSPNLNHAYSSSALFWSSGSTQFINKPSLVNRQRKLTGTDFDELSNIENKLQSSNARKYVESLHQSSNSSLLFGKNNVLCQPREDVNKLPGYLSLHMAVNELLIKWTPNELMSGGLNDSPFKDCSAKIEWDCALIIWVNKIVYIHCHQQVDKGETLVLVNHDGSQNPPFDFPQGGHLMSFLTCLENGLLPKCRLDPPLWLKKNRKNLFHKSCDSPVHDGIEMDSDGPKSAEYIESVNKNSNIFMWSLADRNPIKFNWFQQPFNKRLTIGNRKVLSQPLDHIVFDYRQGSMKNFKTEYFTDLVFRIVRPRHFNYTMGESHSGDEECDEFEDTYHHSSFSTEAQSSPKTVSNWQSEYTVLAVKKRCRLSRSDREKGCRKSSSIRVLCSSMKKEIMARSFYGWLAYSRHMKTIRNHLNQLVLSTDLDIKKDDEIMKQSLTKCEWENAFNSNHQIEEHLKVLRHIYIGGCDPEIRPQTWPFLLGMYDWNSTQEQRESILQKWTRHFQVAVSDVMVIETVLAEQQNESPPQTDENEEICVIEIERQSENKESQAFRNSAVPETKVMITRKILNTLKENWNRIEKDVARCDRHFRFFGQTKKGEANLKILQRIMCTWVLENLELGYIQGMCDLLAPILVVFHGQEELAYACFTKFMERMISNFPVKDSTKMDLCFSRMRSAVQILDSDLLDHMQSYGDFTHFYFSYRWFLLDFKREFSYKDVFCLWETIWAADSVATPFFSLFVGLALLLSYRDVIIDNGMEFTDIIRFFNEMAEQHNVQKVLELARELVEKLQLLLHS